MKLPDLTELALRNLRESVLRNALTTVGIAVGVASLVAMLSLGIGLQQLASRRLVKSGLFDTVLVTSRRDLRNFGREPERTGPAAGESRILDEPAAGPVRSGSRPKLRKSRQAASDHGGRAEIGRAHV